MQGRLLPKILGQFQCFPAGVWEQEFKLCKKLGINKIEFIFDDFFLPLNPLLNIDGIKKIKKLEKKFSVKVNSICADYFMKYPIYEKNNYKRLLITNVLKNLFQSASKLNIKNIVLPCVDSSSLNSYDKIKIFIKEIKKLEKFLDKKKIYLSIESDLNPKKFNSLMNNFKSKYVSINYDIGNSAALGYDFKEELNLYHNKISEVHIKDRKLNGPSVLIGTGAAKIKEVINFLNKKNYKGDYVFQLYRDQNGFNIFKKQLDYFNKKIIYKS